MAGGVVNLIPSENTGIAFTFETSVHTAEENILVIENFLLFLGREVNRNVKMQS